MAQEKLPQEFKRYFWDVDFEKISLNQHFNQVLSRLLSFGNMQAIRWVLTNVKSPQLKQYVLKFGDRQLDKRSLKFWKLYLDLS